MTTKAIALFLILASTTACTSSAAKPLAAPESPIKALLARTEANLVPLKGGSFEMGDWGNAEGIPYDYDRDSKPLHKVTLDDFAMLKYKVTYEEFDVFTDAVGEPRIDMSPVGVDDRSPKRPAGVSWYGAETYCAWLAKETGEKFALPTEAQWEYAARSGGSKDYLYATDNGKLEFGRNYNEHGLENSLYDVGKYPPNPGGFYGMSDFTLEWVFDWYDKDYYKNSPEKNPIGPATGLKKVHRGSAGSPDIGAYVFVRSSRMPKPIEKSAIRIPFDTKYSGSSFVTFRCVKN